MVVVRPITLVESLRWVDDGAQTTVRKQCMVTFSIDSYEDKVLSDGVDMDSCHVLLGRP